MLWTDCSLTNCHDCWCLWRMALRADALKPHSTTVMKHFRKQLLITTSSQICHIRNTKDNIWLKLMKKLYVSCFQSFIQSILKLLQIWVHSPQIQTHFQLHFYHLHLCWLNVACCVVDVCVKLQISVITSDKHCTLKRQKTEFEADSCIPSKVIRGSQHYEIGSRDPGHAHLGVILWSTPRRVLYVCTKFDADSSISSKVIRGPKIWKLGHMTGATTT